MTEMLIMAGRICNCVEWTLCEVFWGVLGECERMFVCLVGTLLPFRRFKK